MLTKWIAALVVVSIGGLALARTQDAPPPEKPPASDKDATDAARQSLRESIRMSLFSGPSAPSRLMGMMRAKAVHQDLESRELGIDDDQSRIIGRVADLAADLHERMQKKELEFNELDEPERSLKLKDIQDRKKQALAAADQMILKGVLASEQAARVRQIGWQSDPINSLIDDPELKDLLKLTPAQKLDMKQRLKAAYASYQTPEIMERRALSKRSDDPAVQAKIAAEDAAHGQRVFHSVYDSLNPEQLANYRLLLGPLLPRGTQQILP